MTSTSPRDFRSPGWDAVRERVLAFIHEGWSVPRRDDRFDDIARFIFAYQFEENAPYRAWCERRGRTPGTVQHWTAIPAVPTGAFKEVALVSGAPGDAQAVFRTSGTTQGTDKRGRHYVRDLALYHASLRASFQALLLPDDAVLTMASLVPPAGEMPDSSLAHMIDDVMRTFGDAASAHYATVGGGIDVDNVKVTLRAAEESGDPICLLGTSLSFVHLFERLESGGRHYRLPDGSRLMDTGGFKGARRVIPEEELRAAYTTRLGVPPDHCINEYGMTEMSSQFYDTVLRDRFLRGDSVNTVVREGSTAPISRIRRKLGPPWVRTRAVDPDTLEPLPDGRTGLLQHFDLANAGSVLAIQTEDLGIVGSDGIHLLGRVRGAAPRGCSIAMDELLAAARP